jgi:hypothetical protein
MAFYRNSDDKPGLQPSVVCKILEVKSATREEGGRVVRVDYENSDRVDGFVECYVFGDSMVLATPDESFVGPMPREYFGRWYRRCDIDGNWLDV